MKVVISLMIWVAGAFLTIILFFVVLFLTLALLPFDKKRKVGHAQCYWWANTICRLNPYWNVGVKGIENIDPRQTYVIVANHQSLADIIILYKTHMQFKWVAKESLFKIPFLGWTLSLIRHIRLSRGRFGSIKKVLLKAAWWLRNDVSVFFFPEGTRSSTGKMNKFQNGAFKLAIKEKRPILPIRVEGTKEAIPKGGWLFKTRVNGKLTVLPPVDTSDFKTGDFRQLNNIVWSKLANVT